MPSLGQVAGRRWVWMGYWGIAIYLALALAATGLAWRRFASTPGTSLLNTPGRVLGGKLTGFWTSGVGINKDYFLQIEGTDQVFMIPASIVNPIFAPNLANPMDLSKFIDVDSVVTLRVTGGDKPIVLEVLLREGNADRQLLTFGISVTRFEDTVRRAADIGNRYLLAALVLLPIAAALWLLVLRFIRTRQSDTPESPPHLPA